MSIETDTITLPADYASYLINGDHSSLSQEEVDMIDTWLEEDQHERDYYIVDVSEETTFARCPISGLYSDLAEYTIIYR